MIDEEQLLNEKRSQIEIAAAHIGSGLIGEFGCGSGYVVQFLAEKRPGSRIIGIDTSVERLRSLADKKLSDGVPICADITKPIIADATLDSAALISTLHVVFSKSGVDSVTDVLKNVHDALKPGSMLVIQDFLKPESRRVGLTFVNASVDERFCRFANEFQPREVAHSGAQGSITCDIADAIEFIGRYRITDEIDWREEMRETHFYFTEDQFRHAVSDAGFEVIDVTRMPKLWSLPDDVKDDIDFDFEIKVEWIQVVGRRKGCTCC